MQVTVQRLTSQDRAHLAELWHAATKARRQGLGLDGLPADGGSALDRPGAFGVGVLDGRALVSAAVALPALADDGRGERAIAGLAHVSSVATAPTRWGEGFGRLVLRGIELQAMRRGLPGHSCGPTQATQPRDTSTRVLATR